MALTCPTCSRVNPAEALFCHHDGVALRGAASVGDRHDPGSRPFLSPFVFPSGLTCSTFDQLTLACVNHWQEARDLLRQGHFAGFLGAIGRVDLARAATEAARYPDPERGLDQFLARLPGKALEPAKLAVQPRQINLGHLRAGSDRTLELHLSNEGMGLLYGSVSCEDGHWLAVGEGLGVSSKMFQLRADDVIAVQVRGQHLRAGNKPLQGRIVVTSNGGTETVVVTAAVPVQPFPEGVLAGARSPRQVAEKAKANPKGAAVLFENGAVAAWYGSNGWSYPVLGPAASGLAAVQQFFEALGLTAPPKVEISQAAMSLTGKPGESLRQTLVVSSPEKRPVYARASSNRPWLRVAGVKMEGRTASVQLAVAAVPDQPGETLQATVTVTSNGNQCFEVPVSLRVTGVPRRAAARVPILEIVEQPEEVGLPVLTAAAPLARVVPDFSLPGQPVMAAVLVEATGPAEAPPIRKAKVPVLSAEMLEIPEEEDHRRPDRRQSRRWQHALPVAFLAVGLFVALLHDIIIWGLAASGDGSAPPDLDDSGPGPTIALKFHEEPFPISVGKGGFKSGGALDRNRLAGVWDPTMRFGLVMIEPGADLLGSKPKKLTFKEIGITNNTCVWLDGKELLFGEKPARMSNNTLWPPGNWPGRWIEAGRKIGHDGQGRRSIWFYDDEKVGVTQTVEVVRGAQSGRPDTCLVRYRLDNQDTREHTVGLRFLLDTYIGGNDGVPFLIPGQRELCSTALDFRPPTPIPDFLQALENESLTNPGTIAQVQLRVGGKVEPPTRVTIGAYPNPLLGERLGDRHCRQEKTLWEVPVYSMKTLTPGDSAVVLYWEPRRLGPGEQREVGFSYGLGNVSGKEGKGKLALTVGGSFQAGGEFTATAYVSNPQPGQTLKLSVPEGFELIDKDATQEVPLPPAESARRISPVSWRVRSPRRQTTAELEARLSTGQSQKVRVRITIKDIFGN